MIMLSSRMEKTDAGLQAPVHVCQLDSFGTGKPKVSLAQAQPSGHLTSRADSMKRLALRHLLGNMKAVVSPAACLRAELILATNFLTLNLSFSV